MMMLPDNTRRVVENVAATGTLGELRPHTTRLHQFITSSEYINGSARTNNACSRRGTENTNNVFDVRRKQDLHVVGSRACLRVAVKVLGSDKSSTYGVHYYSNANV